MTDFIVTEAAMRLISDSSNPSGVLARIVNRHEGNGSLGFVHCEEDKIHPEFSWKRVAAAGRRPIFSPVEAGNGGFAEPINKRAFPSCYVYVSYPDEKV